LQSAAGMTTSTVQISWKLSLVMSLLLLAPGVSLAADGETPLPAAATPTAPSLLETQEKAEPKQPPHAALRVAAEIGAMSLTSAALGAGGLLMGLTTCDGDLSCLDTAGYGMLGGISVGAPIGTWWGGKLAGGRGTFLGSALGAGAGLLAGAGAALLVTNDNIEPFCFPLGAIIGSVVGYEMSHSMAPAPRPSMASAGVLPVLAFSRQGAVLGLNGIF
jgi:hypothetical protein